MSNNKKKTKFSEITYPNGGFFTIDDLFKLNPNTVSITLRVQLKKEVEELHKAAVIGTLKGSHGRPKNVYTTTPVLKEVVDAAQSSGVVLIDKSELVKVFEVSSVKAPTPTTSPIVNTVLTTTPSTNVVSA